MKTYKNDDSAKKEIEKFLKKRNTNLNDYWKHDYKFFCIKNNDKYICCGYDKINKIYYSDIILGNRVKFFHLKVDLLLYSGELNKYFIIKNLKGIGSGCGNLASNPIIIYEKRNDKMLHMLKYAMQYNLEEINNIYTAGLRQKYGLFNKKNIVMSQLVIYKNNELVYSHNNVNKIYNFDNNKIILYRDKRYVYSYGLQTNALIKYNIDSKNFDYIMKYGESIGYINFFKNKSLKLDKDEDLFYFYFSFDNSKMFNILANMIEKADKVEIINNIFDDDTTINYKVGFDITRKEDILYCIYISLYKYTNVCKIYHCDIYKVVNFLCYNEECYKLFLAIDNNNDDYINIAKKLKERYCNNNEKAVNSLANRYGEISLLNNCDKMMDIRRYIYRKSKFSIKEDSHVEDFLNKKFKNRYNEDYSNLVASNKIKVKWKSEQDLYCLVKNKFNNAIYQYKADWLGKQSLDIYIPEIKTAIEYQGIQHYQPVDFFCGELGYEIVKERDEIKINKCKSQGVKLVYWKYDRPITEYQLNKILTEKVN